MNGRSITARVLATVLLLPMLWPLGGCAGDAGQAHAAPPASSAAQAVVLPSAPAASAPSVAAAVPAALQGRWTPISNALASAGPLTLDARALHWSICGQAERPFEPQVTDGGQQVLIALAANGASPCKLGSQPVTHLRLSPRPGNACELEATLYGQAPQSAQQQLLAWGVFNSERCPAGRAP
jgi:hypothetical protein